MKRDPQFYETILNSVADIVYVRDMDMNIVFMNPAAERITGVSLEQARTRKCHDLFGDRPLTCNRNCPGTRAINEQLALTHSEGMMVSVDGAPIKLGVSISPLFDGTTPTGAIFVLQDITKQRATEISRLKALMRLEEEVQRRDERERQVQRILESAMDGIATLGEGQDLQSFNPACEAMFGYHARDVIGRPLSMLVPGSEREDGTLQPLDLPVMIGQITEIQGIQADGERFPLELAVSQYEIDSKAMYSIVFRDISERRRVDILKREFLSTVSHELRTPLTSIIGSLGLLDQSPGTIPQKQARLVEIARDNADRLLALVNDLLDMEKIESGNFKLHTQPCNLIGLLEKAVVANQGFAERHSVSLATSGVVPDVSLLVDPTRIQQVLSNLLSNAIKFSDAGQTVLLAVEQQPEGVRIQVSDKGIGIPEASQQNIFDKFTQADSSDTRAIGGTGLGLSITKAIVEQHQGRLGFTSTPGEGSTFYFDLPLAP